MTEEFFFIFSLIMSSLSKKYSIDRGEASRRNLSVGEVVKNFFSALLKTLQKKIYNRHWAFGKSFKVIDFVFEALWLRKNCEKSLNKYWDIKKRMSFRGLCGKRFAINKIFSQFRLFIEKYRLQTDPESFASIKGSISFHISDLMGFVCICGNFVKKGFYLKVFVIKI